MSERLNILASLVDTDKVFDVGSDHAILAINLSNKHKVIASDISDSSINKMKENVSKAKANVEVIKSDGLEKLDISINDTVIIAGMGTHTILKILKASIDKIPNTLIIQANNNHEVLRREIVKLGYYIDTEKTIYLNRWYTIIKFKKGNRKYHKLDYILGPNPNMDYVLFNYKIYKKVIKKIPHRYFLKRFKTYLIIRKIKENYLK